MQELFTLWSSVVSPAFSHLTPVRFLFFARTERHHLKFSAILRFLRLLILLVCFFLVLHTFRELFDTLLFRFLFQAIALVQSLVIIAEDKVNAENFSNNYLSEL